MKKHAQRPDNCLFYDESRPLAEQITDWPDVVHFHHAYHGELNKPFVCTEHTNAGGQQQYPKNTIFLSKSHARNHNGQAYVYNGLEWDEYGEPCFKNNKQYVHFLGKAKTRLKNLDGAAWVAKQTDKKMCVLGGRRIQLGKNGYCNLDFNLRFQGMVGGDKKFGLIKNSAALLFPVRWHEPFGLAITESLFLGTPVVGSNFGALPEIIATPEVGQVSDNYQDMLDALHSVESFDRKACHELARDVYNSDKMAQGYMHYYQQVINGEPVHQQAPYAEQSYKQPLPLGGK